MKPGIRSQNLITHVAKSKSEHDQVILPGAVPDMQEVGSVARCFRGRILFMVVTGLEDKHALREGRQARSRSSGAGGVTIDFGRNLSAEALLGIEEGQNGRPAPQLALLVFRDGACHAVPFRNRGCGRAPTGSLFVDLALFCAAHSHGQGLDRAHHGGDAREGWAQGVRATFLMPSAFVHQIGGGFGR